LAYKIAFKGSVLKDLRNIDKKGAERILSHIEKDLVEKAATYPVLSGKFAGLRKYRVGDYCIIFSLIGDSVLVLRIRHRREVYK
jgi:mRNA interferase RelE/StbE